MTQHLKVRVTIGSSLISGLCVKNIRERTIQVVRATNSNVHFKIIKGLQNTETTKIVPF